MMKNTFLVQFVLYHRIKQQEPSRSAKDGITREDHGYELINFGECQEEKNEPFACLFGSRIQRYDYCYNWNL